MDPIILKQTIAEFVKIPEAQFGDEKTKRLALSILKNLDVQKVKRELIGKLLNIPFTASEKFEVANNLSRLEQLQKPLGADGDLIARTAPEMLSSAAAVKEALAISSDPHVAPATRAKYLPQSTGPNTTNGSYFLYTSFSEKPAFVGKPAIQEAGSTANPQNNEEVRLGIAPGEGVIRERLIYKGQQLLGIDCGVPPTCILSCESHQLSSEVKNDQAVEYLADLKKVEPDFEPHQFVRLMAKFESVKKLVEHFQQKPLTPLQLAIHAEVSVNSEVTPAKLLKLHAQYGAEKSRQEFLQDLKKELDYVKELKRLPEKIAFLFNYYLQLPTITEPNPCSIQKFVKNSISMRQLLSNWTQQQQEAIPVGELHKLVIDNIFFNTDRHSGNILFSKDKIHLIDHGLCLPTPSQNGKELTQARMELMTLPQFLKPLCEPFASTIKDLDIEHFISALKEDQEQYSKQFGKICDISDEGYNLIRFNLHLLKVGIAQDVPLRSICLLQNPVNFKGEQFGGEVIELYQTHFGTRDWEKIDQQIAQILQKPFEMRKRSGERIEKLFVELNKSV